MMADNQKVPVNVSVAESHVAGIDDVAAQLRAAGLDVTQTLKSVGTISGRVTTQQLAGLSKVPGVSAVEREESFQLPPPGSDVQ